jgi:RluA family pseudouridine synthase
VSANAPASPAFDILFEDGPCLAVNKPPGVLTQAPPGIDSLEVRIKAFLKERGGSAAEVYLGVPHRLDRPVSGAMVFALDRRTTRRLAAQFESRRVRKTYWACVSGLVEPPGGTWVDQVRKIPGRPRAEIVGPDHEEGRQAILHYRTLGSNQWGSVLEIELETGRMHQIRIQAASRGHPVLGDAEYGSTVPFGPQYEDVRLRAIALHARTLAFRHPATRRDVVLTAPLPWNEQGDASLFFFGNAPAPPGDGRAAADD